LVKNTPAMQEDLGLIPDLGKSPGEGSDCLLQYSCPESHGQRTLADYSACSLKRVGHN